MVQRLTLSQFAHRGRAPGPNTLHHNSMKPFDPDRGISAHSTGKMETNESPATERNVSPLYYQEITQGKNNMLLSCHFLWNLKLSPKSI